MLRYGSFLYSLVTALVTVFIFNVALADGGLVVDSHSPDTDYETRIKQKILNGGTDQWVLPAILSSTLFQEWKVGGILNIDDSKYLRQVETNVQGRYSNDDLDTVDEAFFEQEVDERLNPKAQVRGVEEVFSEFSAPVEHNKPVSQGTEDVSDADNPGNSSSDNGGATGGGDQGSPDNSDSSQEPGDSEQQVASDEADNADMASCSYGVERYPDYIEGGFNDPDMEGSDHLTIIFFSADRQKGVSARMTRDLAISCLKAYRPGMNKDECQLQVFAPVGLDWAEPSDMATALKSVAFTMNKKDVAVKQFIIDDCLRSTGEQSITCEKSITDIIKRIVLTDYLMKDGSGAHQRLMDQLVNIIFPLKDYVSIEKHALIIDSYVDYLGYNEAKIKLKQLVEEVFIEKLRADIPEQREGFMKCYKEQCDRYPGIAEALQPGRNVLLVVHEHHYDENGDPCTDEMKTLRKLFNLLGCPGIRVYRSSSVNVPMEGINLVFVYMDDFFLKGDKQDDCYNALISQLASNRDFLGSREPGTYDFIPIRKFKRNESISKEPFMVRDIKGISLVLLNEYMLHGFDQVIGEKLSSSDSSSDSSSERLKRLSLEEILEMLRPQWPWGAAPQSGQEDQLSQPAGPAQPAGSQPPAADDDYDDETDDEEDGRYSCPLCTLL